MAKSVWLITTGEYSNYRVLAAFATKALAEEFVARHVKEGDYDDSVYSVEAFPLYEDSQPAERTLWAVTGYVGLDGVRGQDESFRWIFEFDQDPPITPMVGHHPPFPSEFRSGNTGRCWTWAQSFDLEEVRRLFREEVVKAMDDIREAETRG